MSSFNIALLLQVPMLHMKVFTIPVTMLEPNCHICKRS